MALCLTVRQFIVEKINDNEGVILKYINQNPGCHLRQLKRDLDLSMGTVQYHLNSLEKLGKIVSERFNLHRHYFASGIFKDNEKNILKILNQDTARQILMYIVERKYPNQTDIVNNIKISPASVNWHIKRLLELGIIVESKEGRFKKYQLAIGSSIIVNLLKNYYPNLWNRWSSRIAEVFLSLSMESDQTD
jgi:predicted transcriptional regulator